MISNILNRYEMDLIPQYIFEKKIRAQSELTSIISLKKLESINVKKITDQQFNDGSWDRFHTLSSKSKTNITTENAVRRLLILGLDKNDEPIKQAYSYMDKFLKKEIDYRDGKEKFSDWNEITDLFTAAWMLEIDNKSEIASHIADKWAELITRSFTGDSFNFDDYSKAFQEIFNVKAGKRVWDIESFHIVAIVYNRIQPETEEKFIDYILNNDKGIYYIANRGKLSQLPLNFMSRETSSFLYAHKLLSRYSSYKKRSGFVSVWLSKNRGQDGLWDLGPKVKDNVFFPYSESWRNPINRKIDCTLFIQEYLYSINET